MPLYRALAYGASAMTAFVAVGAIAMALGEPTAINAVIGAGIPGATFWVASLVEYRISRRS